MEYKKIYTHLLLSGAMFLGLLLSIESVAIYTFGPSLASWIFMVYGIVVTVYIFKQFGSKVAISRPSERGFSYGSALGFFVLMAMLSGVIVGVTEYVIQNIVDPAYGEQLTQAAGVQVAKMMPGAPDGDMARAMSMARSMWGLILGSVFFKALNGAFLGLFVAAFIKKEPKISEQNN